MARVSTCIQTAGVAFLVASCGDAPASPTPFVPPPQPVHTLTGRVVGTVTGEPIANATVTIGPHTLVSDENGSFRLEAVSATNRIEVRGDGLVTRSSQVFITSREVTVDVIQDRAPFDLAYFREIGRNAFETEGALEPLRPLQQAPNVHIRTVDAAGDPVPDALLDMVEAALRESAPIWSGGRLPLTTVTRGPETREGASGWVTVLWPADDHDLCGQATIGTSTGRIELFYKNDKCACGGLAIGPRTVRHELGHVYGFWHASGRGEVMSTNWTLRDCDQRPSRREQEHAKYLYARKAGNLDRMSIRSAACSERRRSS